MDSRTAIHFQAWLNHSYRPEEHDIIINATLLYLAELSDDAREYVLNNWTWREITDKAINN